MALFIDTETKEYPITEDDIRSRHPNISFPRVITQTSVISFGYQVVNEVNKPEGDVVTEGEPNKRPDGSWVQTWNVREFNEDELADRANLTREESLKKGIPYKFPESTEIDAIQVTDRDMTILNTLYIFAKDNLDNPDYRQIYRSVNNINYELTAQQVIDMTTHVFNVMQNIYKASWELKDK